MSGVATNHQIRLASRPVGLPEAANWELTTETVPEPGPGEFVVAVSYVSIDPAMRRWIDTAPSFSAPVGLGDVMEAGALGCVTASNHENFGIGENLYGAFGVQEFALSDGAGVTRLDPLIAPLDAYLGALGITGLTAYFGVLEIGRPQPGETVVVSGAAGAVGSIAGQLARIRGCRVIGIAGGPEKCAWLTGELGFDAAIDYQDRDVARALLEHAPNGVDVFLDNVGGDVLDAVLTRLARSARVVIAGATSQYNAVHRRGPANYLSLLDARASMTGMLTPDYADRYPEARTIMADWIRDGTLISRQDILTGGVAAFPDALLKLFAGANVGKLLLRVP